MTKLELEIFDDVVATLNKIKNINDSGIELVLPQNSVLFENVLNLKLIKNHADKYGIAIHFETNDPAGNTLIEMVEEGTGRFSMANTVTTDMDLDHSAQESYSHTPKFSPMVLVASALGSLGGIKKALRHLPLKMGILPPIIIALLLVALYHFAKNTSDAEVKLIINSQPLTKSITIKVKSGTPTNAETRILAGTNVQDTIDISKEIDTTGEKIVGEKAVGKIKIFNKTDEDKEFKKGHEVKYEDLVFKLDDEIVVDAATEDNTDPLNPVVVYGEVEVDVTAAQVGEDYNIDENKALSVDDHKKADFSAVTTEDFSGGKSEKIKVVAEADVTAAKAALDKDTAPKADEALNKKIASTQFLVKGSSKNTVVKESLNIKVGEEAEKLTVTRTVTVEGLVYLKEELNRLLDTLTKEFVPEGFVLSSKDREVTVDVLGASTSSVLNSTEADVQVTLKTFVVPDISEDNIKSQIAGKSAQEAESILGTIRNIKTFALKVNKGIIPLFNKIPKDVQRIHVEIVKE